MCICTICVSDNTFVIKMDSIDKKRTYFFHVSLSMNTFYVFKCSIYIGHPKRKSKKRSKIFLYSDVYILKENAVVQKTPGVAFDWKRVLCDFDSYCGSR